MKKLLVTCLLLAGVLETNAQNISSTAALTSGGNLAGTVGVASTYYGNNAGKISTGTSNTFIGSLAGSSNTTGINNVYLGRSSGLQNLGSNNTFSGANSGGNSGCVLSVCSTTGNFNSFYGSLSGNANNGGNNNAFFGANAGGIKNTTGSNNTYLGYSSGATNNGSGNVFLGVNSGPSGNSLGTTVNNQLFVDNSVNSNPLIWGDFANDQLKLNGTVGIGSITAFPTSQIYSNYKLFVTGGILTEEMRVALASTWADYVFAKDYNLKPLSEVEKYINENGHLANVPSAEQIKNEGINVGEMAKIQQEKMEELTLYIIQQNKRIEALEAKINSK